MGKPAAPVVEGAAGVPWATGGTGWAGAARADAAAGVAGWAGADVAVLRPATRAETLGGTSTTVLKSSCESISRRSARVVCITVLEYRGLLGRGDVKAELNRPLVVQRWMPRMRKES